MIYGVKRRGLSLSNLSMSENIENLSYREGINLCCFLILLLNKTVRPQKAKPTHSISLILQVTHPEQTKGQLDILSHVAQK